MQNIPTMYYDNTVALYRNGNRRTIIFTGYKVTNATNALVLDPSDMPSIRFMGNIYISETGVGTGCFGWYGGSFRVWNASGNQNATGVIHGTFDYYV